MSRLQLALNVSNIDDAVTFYSKLFGAQPAKRRPGYANFALTDPPLKLVLIETSSRGSGTAHSLNHLGVEVETTEEVASATSRLTREGLTTTVEASTTCCYALQDKVWVEDPNGTPWEVYTVLADAPHDDAAPASTQITDGCCGGVADEVAVCCSFDAALES